MPGWCSTGMKPQQQQSVPNRSLESFSGRLRVASVFVCMRVCVSVCLECARVSLSKPPYIVSMEHGTTPTDDGRQSVCEKGRAV